MKNFSKALIWEAVNEEDHPGIKMSERTISLWMPLISELFPGINYYSISGFTVVYNDYLKPVVKKLFPDFAGIPAEEVSPEETVEVKSFLPSDGYEHLDDPDWKKKLDSLLTE